MRIDPQKTICIAIDYQEKLLPAMQGREELMKKSVFMINCLKELGVRMIMTTQYAKGLGGNDPAVVELIGEENCIDKNTFSVYGSDAVKAIVEEGGYKNIIICGTESHICVMQSLIDFQEAGYNVIYVADCVASRNQFDREMALVRAQHEGAICTSAEALIYELTVGSKNPAFKAISNLVKAQ